MTYRELIIQIMNTMQNLDDRADIIIMTRDPENTVIYKEMCPVSRVGMKGIWIENRQIVDISDETIILR